MSRTIVDRCGVERPNLGLAALTFLSPVKTATRFITQNAALNHLGEHFRNDKRLAFFIVRECFVKILNDVREDVQTDQIESAERCTLWSTYRWSSDLIDLFYCVSIVEHCADGMERAESPYSVGNEVRTIFRRHNALAESLIEKPKKEARHFRLGPFGPDYLHEMKVTRWIEEVYAKEMLLEVV